MQRVAGRKGILALTREGDAIEMTPDRSAIGTGLIEQDFHSMRQQPCRGRNQHSMVGCSLAGFTTTAGAEPAG